MGPFMLVNLKTVKDMGSLRLILLREVNSLGNIRTIKETVRVHIIIVTAHTLENTRIISGTARVPINGKMAESM